MARDPLEINPETITKLEEFFTPSEWDKFLEEGIVDLAEDYPVLTGYIGKIMSRVPSELDKLVMQSLMSVLMLIKYEHDLKAAKPKLRPGNLSPFDD